MRNDRKEQISESVVWQHLIFVTVTEYMVCRITKQRFTNSMPPPSKKYNKIKQNKEHERIIFVLIYYSVVSTYFLWNKGWGCSSVSSYLCQNYFIHSLFGNEIFSDPPKIWKKHSNFKKRTKNSQKPLKILKYRISGDTLAYYMTQKTMPIVDFKCQFCGNSVKNVSKIRKLSEIGRKLTSTDNFLL